MLTTSASAQWTQTNWSISSNFLKLHINQDKVFAQTWDTLAGGRLYLSTDAGSNWTQIAAADDTTDILSLVMIHDTILAGTWNGLYRSTAGSTSWTEVTATGIPADTAIWSLAMVDADLFAGTRGKIYKSSDSGASWTDMSSGLLSSACITSIVPSGSAILAGSDSNGVFITTNGGTSWTAINTGLTNKRIFQLAAMGNKLFAVTLGGVFSASNNGTSTSWAAYSSSIGRINGFIAINNQLFAGTDSSAVYLSTDSGATWGSSGSGMTANTRVWSLATSSGYDLFAGTSSGIWSNELETGPGIPALSAPSNGALNQPATLTLSWSSVSSATSYGVQVSTALNFGSTLFGQVGLTATSYAIGSLPDGTTYYWRANAGNTEGTSNWSTAWSFSTVIDAPAAPGLTSPSNGAAGQATTLSFSWGSVSTATTYGMQVSTVSTFVTLVSDQDGLTAPSATAGGLANSTTYYWRANAANAGGTSAWATAWSFTTIIAAPAAPVLTSPSNGVVDQALSLVVSWGSVGTATTYGVQVSTGSTFAALVSDQKGLTAPSATAGGLANSMTYYWRANASNGGGTSDWSLLWSFTTIMTAPAAPVLTSPSNGVIDQALSLVVSWSSVGTATTYGVQVSTTATFATVILVQNGLTVQSATAGGLANGTTYFWRANAANAGGTGAWAVAWSFTTLMTTPATPTLTAPANGAVNQPTSLTLFWASDAAASSYGVQVSTDLNFGSTIFGLNGFGTNAQAIGVLANTTVYFWRVNAANLSGTSAWSGAWSFTTAPAFSGAIEAGWNIVSLNIHPLDSSVVSVFGDTLSQRLYHRPKGLIVVKNLSGSIYFPSLGIKGFDTVHTGSGYQMYSDSVDNLFVSGTKVDVVTTPVYMKQGWNLLGYLPDTNLAIATALDNITVNLFMAKDNQGRVFWPGYGINNIGTMQIGQGYFTYMKLQDTLNYPVTGGSPKQQMASRQELVLPCPVHYGSCRNTGNNATILAEKVTFENGPAPDSSEIAAFDAGGNLVGAGSVMSGTAAFAVWGDDQMTKDKDGCGPSERLSFKLWVRGAEYPACFLGDSAGGSLCYQSQGIFVGRFFTPQSVRIGAFGLSRVYPNPFRGAVRIQFDVPALRDIASHEVHIDVYDLHGSLVKRLARGSYPTGQYSVVWNPADCGTSASNTYIIRMQAPGYDKRVKIIRLK